MARENLHRDDIGIRKFFTKIVDAHLNAFGNWFRARLAGGKIASNIILPRTCGTAPIHIQSATG
jgi:hypothetical protein